MSSKFFMFAVAILVAISYNTDSFAEEDFELKYDIFYNPSMISSGDKLIFLTTSDRNAATSISVLDTKTGSLLYKIENPRTDVDDEWFGKHLVVFGNNIAASSSFLDPETDKWTTLIHVFDSDTGELLYTIENPVSDSMSFGYSMTPVGNNLAAYASDKDPNDDIDDNVVHIFGDSGTLLYTIENPDDYGDFGRYLTSIDDTLLVNVLDRGYHRGDIPEIIYAFEGETGRLLYTIEYPKQTNPHPDKSFGRSTLISGDNIVVRSENTVFIYDGNTGELRHTVDHTVTTNNELQMILDSIDDKTNDYSLLVLIAGVAIGGVVIGIILWRKKMTTIEGQH